KERPYIWDDGEHALDEQIACVNAALTADENGLLFKALKPTIDWLRSKRYTH
ncbi:unnamed protein product, partial [Adineta steineri]